MNLVTILGLLTILVCLISLGVVWAKFNTFAKAHATCPECAGPEVTKIFCCEGGLELHPTCKAPASDEVYKKALERISQMSMSQYLSVNDLAKEAIRTAQEALGGR